MRCFGASGRWLQPHRVETFKFSNDPDFALKLRDIVGPYMNPEDKAIVLSVDEKSQIQALARPQPILPLRPGLPERQTYDYRRHGTTTLFVALNVLEGTVIGECQPWRRHQEFLPFPEGSRRLFESQEHRMISAHRLALADRRRCESWFPARVGNEVRRIPHERPRQWFRRHIFRTLLLILWGEQRVTRFRLQCMLLSFLQNPEAGCSAFERVP